MHATKVGWVGQTFALAKCSDSGGKKSRIRRSKEERKAMVESFVKKYQNSNNGSFPSLNLTHKEVGGSFYTVREIVREIIQENRVLGPAKLTPEEQIADNFSEQFPLGSISIEPQIYMSPSNETHTVTHILPNRHPDTNEEKALDQHKRLDDEKFVDWCTKEGEKIEDFEPESIHRELRLHVEGEKNVETKLQESELKTTQLTADGAVETFLIRPVCESIHGLGGKLGDTRSLTGTVKEKELENMELEAGKFNSVVLGRMDIVENSSGLVDEKAETNLAGPFPESHAVLVDEKADPTLLERLNCSSTTKENIALDANDGTIIEVKDSLPIGNKPIKAQNLNSTNTSSSHAHSVSREAIGLKNKPHNQHGGSSKKESNQPLHRINLESWEATSEKSAKRETNPLLAYFKAFVVAFVKFWSE